MPNETSASAQALSQEAALVKLGVRANNLKAEGIPPVLVDEIVNIVKNTNSDQKLSTGGAETSLEDMLFNLINKLPITNRINLSQLGTIQYKSNDDNGSFAYEDVINQRTGKAQS